MSAPRPERAARPARRFPAPWRIEETQGGYRISDASGQHLLYVYGEDEEGRRQAMRGLTRDEARRIALGIARLPDLLQAEREREGA